MNRLLATVFVGVAVLGVAPAAPVPKGGDTPLYFPTEVGTKWVVRHPWMPAGYSDMTYTVTAVEEKDGAKVVTVSEAYTVDWSGIIKVVGREGPDVEAIDRPDARYRVSTDGVFVLANYDLEKKRLVDREEPGCILRFPAKPGHSEKGADAAGRYNWAKTVGKPERVKVTGGTFDAIRVDVESTQDGKEYPHWTGWYAPGIGLVKVVYGGEVKVELVSFTPAKK
ncbi:MAG: hypothetical protein C0501_13670 [Isosphaera sp.]|nr:hypothetical protein [Isosphaera sp.]